jgi:hypothetical protein
VTALNRERLMRNGPGLAGSALLHAMALLLIAMFFRQAAKPDAQLRTVLIDIIHVGAETTSPPAPVKSAAPSQPAFARRAPAAHSPDTAVSPHATKPVDELENRLNALAKLRAPETDTRALQGPGTARDATASDGAAPGGASYALRDFLRAQIERRWNLDLDVLGSQRIVVALRVIMKANGTILAADIVDKQRYASDQAYRRIAMSARNAVLLASPIALPAGDYPPQTELTLLLDPRDTMR